jgi:hypothetical protein
MTLPHGIFSAQGAVQYLSRDRAWIAGACVGALLVLIVPKIAAQTLRIGIIDFYGLRRVSETSARSALAIKEGDAVVMGDARPAVLAESERRLSLLPGVGSARLNLVCCDGGDVIVYVGIEEKDASLLRFREAPRGAVRLSPAVVETEQQLSRAVMAAVQRGDAAEDDSHGHSLMHDPAARALQERFIEYARDIPALRDVLHNSSLAEDRALAAEILGYAANKADVIDDLVYGMNDSSASVRNNAMRALGVIASATHGPVPRIPAEPFIALLSSPHWTDRNKAAFALMDLSQQRDPGLLDMLRKQATEPLAEIARWKSKGHAMLGLLILGRLAGLSDEETEAAFNRGEREAVIDAALRRQ